MLSNEDIISRLKKAFLPYRCEVEVWDYDHKLRFKVFDTTDVSLLAMPEVILSNVRDSDSLNSLIADAQQKLDRRINR